MTSPFKNGEKLAEKHIVLKLNKFSQVIGVEKVRDAFKNFEKGTHDLLDIVYPYDDNGEEVYDDLLNTEIYYIDSFEEWLLTKPRPCDHFLGTGNHSELGGLPIQVRVPTVIRSKNCTKNIVVTPPLTSDNIRLRDNNTCQLSGRTLARGEGNVEHLQPTSKGGENSWENCVWCDRKINTKKGDMTLQEFTKKFGYKLIREPRKPTPQLMSMLIKNHYNLPDWSLFLGK